MLLPRSGSLTVALPLSDSRPQSVSLKVIIHFQTQDKGVVVGAYEEKRVNTWGLAVERDRRAGGGPGGHYLYSPPVAATTNAAA